MMGRKFGEEVAWESLHGIVELTCGRVEEAANGSELVLDVGNLLLQLDEVLVSLQVWVSLKRNLETGECACHHVVSLHLVVYGLCSH